MVIVLVRSTPVLLEAEVLPPAREVCQGLSDVRRNSQASFLGEMVRATLPPYPTLAEAWIMFDADEQFRLGGGREVSVLDLHRGMSVVMADGPVGTILGHPERRYDIPVPPLPVDGGLWTSRIVGWGKHTAHEVFEFR